jgi:hypothetical protein
MRYSCAGAGFAGWRFVGFFFFGIGYTPSGGEISGLAHGGGVGLLAFVLGLLALDLFGPGVRREYQDLAALPAFLKYVVGVLRPFESLHMTPEISVAPPSPDRQQPRLKGYSWQAAAR